MMKTKNKRYSEIWTYIVAAGSSADELTCGVPLRVNNNYIFFGPCMKNIETPYIIAADVKIRRFDKTYETFTFEECEIIKSKHFQESFNMEYYLLISNQYVGIGYVSVLV